MVIVLILSLHVFLLSLYALFITKNRSKLHPSHLLLALCVPVIGEVWLLAAEIGVIKSDEVYSAPSTPMSTSTWKSPVGETPVIPDERISRSELLRAIKIGGNDLPAVLKTALRSDDVEVVHIAAASIMRIQRRHEAEITQLSQEYAAIPEDMLLLMRYVDAVDRYLHTGLLDEESAGQLLRVRRELLENYLRVFPNDVDAKQALDTMTVSQRDL